MKIVFLCGPYRGKNAWEIEQNIRRAEEVSLEVWRSGAACICPHTNTRFFQGAAPDDVWLEGYLKILGMCDAVLTVPGWGESNGSRAEVRLAEELDLPVFHNVEMLRKWVAL